MHQIIILPLNSIRKAIALEVENSFKYEVLVSDIIKVCLAFQCAAPWDKHLSSGINTSTNFARLTLFEINLN